MAEKRARPVDLTQEIAETICEGIACGAYTLEEICKPAGMPSPKSIYRWLNDPAKAWFSDMYAHARERQADAHADDVVGIIDRAVVQVRKLYKIAQVDYMVNAMEKAQIAAMSSYRAAQEANDLPVVPEDMLKAGQEARSSAMRALSTCIDQLPARARAELDGAKARSDARKWKAAKMSSKKYGPKVEATMVGAAGGPVRIELVGGSATSPWMQEALAEDGAIDPALSDQSHFDLGYDPDEIEPDDGELDDDE